MGETGNTIATNEAVLVVKELLSKKPEQRRFSHMCSDVLERMEQTGRHVVVEGREHIPDTGGYILAANHFVRVTNERDMIGPHKMTDMLATIGALNRIVQDKTGWNTTVIWTPSETPRPEAEFPRTSTSRELLEWVTTGAKYIPVNASREVFHKIYEQAPDIIPIPTDVRHQGQEVMTLITERLHQGDVLGFFPEGEVSVSLRKARNGIAHISRMAGASVVPVAIHGDDNELTIRIGQPLTPWDATEPAREYTTRCMSSIADMLPNELRGFYAKSSPAVVD